MPAETLPKQFDLTGLPAGRLREMAAAGADVLECCRVLARTGDNLVGELLRDQGTFYEWTHYPKGDVYDPFSHAQFYYHAHPAGLRGEEHGHFHTFLRPKGMKDGVRPAAVPDVSPTEGDNDALSHLVAISMDPHGLPLRLFTTNRWVTGETWYVAADVVDMLDRFEIDHAQPSWPVNRWITAMIRLFRPQIEALLAERDEAVARWAAAHPDRNVYEDRELEVTSLLDVSVDDQIRAVADALGDG